MDNDKLRVETEVVPHESRLTLVLLRVDPNEPGKAERLDDADLHAENVDASELQDAWEDEIRRQYDFLDDDGEDGPNDRERIRDEMRDATDPRRPSDIADNAGVDYVPTQMLLRELRDEGFVELVDDQGWRRARDQQDE